MTATSFLWHDYETYGRDAARERPVQFAAIRTNPDFEIIEDPVMIYCRQSGDYLPDPEACMVHGVLPQAANQEGDTEWEFARKINAMMSVPGTCTAGYNNIRFDDEFTRQLLFRNLFDPYAREWSNGNSRWDLIDVVRMTRALRPAGIEWPVDSDGKAINKLEALTEANGISHDNAHDALSDVYATIAIARLIKQKQPKLFEFAFSKRTKMPVLASLSLVNKPAVLHVSGMYSSEYSHTSLVMPLGPHPSNSNGILVYDLRHDPQDLIKCTREEIAERLFTRASDLPQGTHRIPVKTVHANRCPIIAPWSVLGKEDKKRLQLNIDQSLKFRDQLLANSNEVAAKLEWAFASREYQHTEDPELTLYSGTFASGRDRQLMQHLQSELTNGTQPENLEFDDSRLGEIWQRVKARSYTSWLTPEEHTNWLNLCHKRVHLGEEGFRSYRNYTETLNKLRSEHSDPASVSMLNELEGYGRQVAEFSASI